MKSLHKIGCGAIWLTMGRKSKLPENISHQSALKLPKRNVYKWQQCVPDRKSSRITPFDGDAFLHSRINAVRAPCSAS